MSKRSKTTRKKQSLNRRTLSIYWRFTRNYKRSFFVSVFGVILGIILQDIIPPIIIARTFAKLQQNFAAGTTATLTQFLPYFIAFTVSMILGAICWRLQSLATWHFELNARRDMSKYLYEHLQNQSQRFHADRFAGAIVSQVNKFQSSYDRLHDEFVWSIVSGTSTMLISMAVLFFVSWQFALVLLAVITIYIIIMYGRSKRQFPFNVEHAARESDQTAALADALTNMGTIRAFAAEKYENARFGKVTDISHDAGMRLSWEVFKTESISHAQTNSFHIIAFMSGLVAVTQFGTNVAVLYLIVNYTQGIVNRLWQFGRVLRNVNRGFGDAAEMTEILGIMPEVKDPDKPEAPRIRRGEVLFKNVSFYYPENKKTPLFKDLNLKIKPGEKIGLVGPSGGGKTTITKLLLRFMDIQEGSISIDGQDITAVTQSDLRRYITYVSQEPILFHRSLMDNIRYGNPDAGKQEVIAVAKMANAHEFIARLPDGYDTMVGERGVKLSGGQRQRVAIARAMLKNAPILVLDEATSALDSESEALIQEALWRLMEGHTAIVIAHRLSTIQKMDRIVVLNNGTVLEQGSHKELLQQNGVYASLWNRQSGGFIED